MGFCGFILAYVEFGFAPEEESLRVPALARCVDYFDRDDARSLFLSDRRRTTFSPCVRSSLFLVVFLKRSLTVGLVASCFVLKSLIKAVVHLLLARCCVCL